MENMKEFEAGLLKKLEAKDMDKTIIRNISKEIVNLKKNGLLIDQVYVKAYRGWTVISSTVLWILNSGASSTMLEAFSPALRCSPMALLRTRDLNSLPK